MIDEQAMSIYPNSFEGALAIVVKGKFGASHLYVAPSRFGRGGTPESSAPLEQGEVKITGKIQPSRNVVRRST
uniref:Uncharacterized protein n=1 Tax=mine drainage metagenome TaxID=410659 RepID=E6PYY2_9ZZZZ